MSEQRGCRGYCDLESALDTLSYFTDSGYYGLSNIEVREIVALLQQTLVTAVPAGDTSVANVPGHGVRVADIAHIIKHGWDGGYTFDEIAAEIAREIDQGADTRAALRHLVDVVWQHATESTAVPSTKTADMLIDRASLTRPESGVGS